MNPFLPMGSNALEVALLQFSRVAMIVSGLIGVVIIARFVLLLVQVASAESYGAVLKDAIVYFVAISLYPSVLKAFFEMTGGLALSIALKNPAPEPSGLFAALDSTLISFLPKLLRDMGVLYISQAIYTLLLSILIAIAPVLIFLSVMIQGAGVAAYVGALVTLSLWPVSWNLLGALAAEIQSGFPGSTVAQIAFHFVVQLLQMFSPIFSVFLFRSLAVGDALKKPVSAALAIRSLGASVVVRKRGRR